MKYAAKVSVSVYKHIKPLLRRKPLVDKKVTVSPFLLNIIHYIHVG